MNIPIKEAIAHFFSNPSFDLIFSEAVANALDAGASDIKISISIKAYSKPETLKMTIEDNGIGFTDKNFIKFSNLLMKADSQHKGLGRLVYLEYFKKVAVESVFEGVNKRTFVFDELFSDKSDLKKLKMASPSFTVLAFSNFIGKRLYGYDTLRPAAIKDKLLKQFLPRLFAIKQQGSQFKISISLLTEESNPKKNFYSDTQELTLDDLPHLQEIKIDSKELDLYNTDFSMLYIVENKWNERPITAICVDGRAIELPLLQEKSIPAGTNAIFLLSSSFFDAKTDDSRQGLALNPQDQMIIERIFTEKISEILNANVPAIQKRNATVRERLSSRYPHLLGYFSQNSLGLIDEEKSVNSAQEAFFKEQKEILNAVELSDEQYACSLNHATRILTEYILYRNLIIKKLENLRVEHPEAKIHDLIVPMQRTFTSKDFFKEIYNNNAWLLDDKYMGYRSILSDENIANLIRNISDEEELQHDDLRPDIAFVFSDDIENVNHPVDVVIVELKKKGLGYLDNTRVIDQIEQRARRLLALYPTKIQRMWFFGIVEFDTELKIKMHEDWTPLFSSGEVYYRERLLFPIDANKNQIGDKKYPVSITLMSFDALWKDAATRNGVFLTILKKSIQQYVDKEQQTLSGNIFNQGESHERQTLS